MTDDRDFHGKRLSSQPMLSPKSLHGAEDHLGNANQNNLYEQNDDEERISFYYLERDQKPESFKVEGQNKEDF
jgi:hypothetical protein